MAFKEYQEPDFPQVGRQILQFWAENRVFERSVETRQGRPTFTFYEGPPSANGKPGIHHVMARTVKDIFCRFKTMQGYQVKRKAGWDTHGLPVELQVEKELGISKEDIGKQISVADYNEKCRQAVMKYTEVWDELTRRVGMWLDLQNPYVTYHQDYIETDWWLLSQLYQKDLLYKGYTIQPYSPAAGTGLSSHELNQPGCYRQVKDTSVVAQFKRADKEDEYFLAWTTTPWTLPANAALAVGKGIRYAKVRTFNAYTGQEQSVVLAEDRLAYYLNEKGRDGDFSSYQHGDKIIPWRVESTFSGQELAGLRYQQLMPHIRPEGENAANAFQVIFGDFVTTEEGTGIVHIAPTFGADDYRTAQQKNIPAILATYPDGTKGPIVDEKGRYVEQMGEFAGKFVKNEYYDNPPEKSLDVEISIKLKEENKAFKVEKYEHSYPHCWRTDKPVLYYPLESWFVRTTALKDRLVALNQTINWKPESTGTGRFGNWLANLVDWNLSRSRYWGTPLPIWRSEDGTEEICIGSREQLRQELEKAQKAGLMPADAQLPSDLHRPYVDELVLVSPSGQALYREPDLIDVWFDSGAMPYAQWHYPFENEEVFKANFPADFISEGVDQTRGWFFTLHAIAVLLFDSVAYKNVISTGLVLDKHGQKMSKRKGNAIDPWETLDEHGPDALRWYMIANAPPWDNLKFNPEGLLETRRKFFGTLFNTYNFLALYANLDAYDPETATPAGENHLTESDRWIRSLLSTLVQEVEAAYQDYDATQACRLIQRFLGDDLSNWYVRLNRKRFWRGEYDANKKAAYETLYTCLETLSRLMAPVAPFYSDQLFRDLHGYQADESVHLADFPQADESAIRRTLEKQMALAQKASSLIHSLRRKHKLKVRQPLARVLVPVLNPEQKQNIEAVQDLILTETNIKRLETVEDSSGLVTKQIKPNFKTLGKRLGKNMKAFAQQVAELGQEDIRRIEQEGGATLEVAGEKQHFALEDFEITSQDMPGWVVASDEGLTVALDLELTENLKQEGLAREVVNRVQNLRKDQGLEVQDRINLRIAPGDEWAKEALQQFSDYICNETQANQLLLEETLPGGQALELEGQQLAVEVNLAQKVTG